MNTNLLNCGHPPTSDAGCGTGYATVRETNERICYACSDARQVADLLTADRYAAYLKAPVYTPTSHTTTGSTLTTWTGGTLALVWSLSFAFLLTLRASELR